MSTIREQLYLLIGKEVVANGLIEGIAYRGSLLEVLHDDGQYAPASLWIKIDHNGVSQLVNVDSLSNILQARPRI